MPDPPESVLGQRERRAEDHLDALLGVARGALGDLRLVADGDAHAREAEIDRLEPLPFPAFPRGLGREDVGLRVRVDPPARLEEMRDVERLAALTNQVRAGEDRLAARPRLGAEERAVLPREGIDARKIGEATPRANPGAS